MKKILHVVSVASPCDEVFAAIATRAGLSSWWSTRVDGSGELGRELRFTFHGDFHPVMRVTTLTQNERVEWTCASGHEPWQDNTFSFALEAVDAAARLTFVQEYARELSDTAYGTYNFNWGYYLNSLKRFCEDGVGTPFNP